MALIKLLLASVLMVGAGMALANSLGDLYLQGARAIVQGTSMQAADLARSARVVPTEELGPFEERAQAELPKDPRIVYVAYELTEGPFRTALVAILPGPGVQGAWYFELH